jgi:glycosyltransferase involved in cell wall biosynthesis
MFVENIAHDPGSHHFSGINNPSLIPTIKAWQPDAILVFGWSFKSHLKCLRHFHGRIPVIFRGDSTLLDEQSGWKMTLRRIFLHWVYSHIDYALVVGRHNRDYFRVHGMKPSQLILARHAVDNDRFAEPDHLYTAKARQWRQELQIQEEDFVILFAGKFEAKKNPLFLLQMADRLRDQRFKFLFVGNGELESEIGEKANTDSRIRMMDFKNQADMPAVYRMAQLFVLPSTGPGETWGLALNESMASGTPVMASNKVGGAIDLIDPGVNGMILDLDNPDSAFSFAERLFQDPAFHAAVAAAGKLKVKMFSFHGIVDSIIGLLDKIGGTIARR